MPIIAWVVLMAAAGGCSGGGPDSSDASPLGANRSTTTTAGDEVPENQAHLVAQSDGQVEVWSAPDDDEPFQVLSASTQANFLLTFLVVQEMDDGWLEVQLPTPPPGSTGFVRGDDISLSRHGFRIEVSRSEHMLRIFVGDGEVRAEPVAIGPDTPQAGTETFVKELLIPPDGTPYGGHVYGLAGYMSTPQQFGAGSGVVAIHATDPAQLGRDVPTGAIGMDRDVLESLVDPIGLPLGTPVVIEE